MRRRFLIVTALVACGAFVSMCLAGDAPAAAAKPAAKETVKASTAAAASPAVKTAAAPAVKGGAGDTLVITARIIEIAGKFPPNDLYNYVYIMKYRVVKVEKGTYAGQDILVGQYNPLIARSQIKDKMAKLVAGNVEKFETGATHRLTLIKPIDKVWKDAVEDEYFDSEMDKFFALKTDMVK